MEGYLGKKGKRMGSRVKRYMRLEGALLSNHHESGTAPTWRVNVRDATISVNSKKQRISIELFKNKLELYADSAAECERWYQALCNAKRSALVITRKGEDKENKSSAEDANVSVKMNSTTDTSIERKESQVLAELGKNFKVVKPASRARTESSDSDEAYPGDQLVVQGQKYEETPASMIFKQFNFPAK